MMFRIIDYDLWLVDCYIDITVGLTYEFILMNMSCVGYFKYSHTCNVHSAGMKSQFAHLHSRKKAGALNIKP